MRKQGCAAASIKAEPLEAVAWDMCSELLRDPNRIAEIGEDHCLYLKHLDANRARETQKLQQARADQEAAKQRVIGLVRRGKIGDADADCDLDQINTDIDHLDAELRRPETTHSLAAAYAKRLEEAEAVVREVAGLSDTPENRRRAIEALLQHVEVQSSGEGRAKKADAVFYWLGQPPTFGRLHLSSLRNIRTSEALLNEVDTYDAS